MPCAAYWDVLAQRAAAMLDALTRLVPWRRYQDCCGQRVKEEKAGVGG